MKIAVVSGSHRKDSQSERVAVYIAKRLQALKMESEVIALCNNRLPMWDEGVWGDDPKWREVWSPIATTLSACSGLIVVAPEWAGMVPPALKNFLLLCSSREVGHKPAMIVGVSSGVGGSYPIAELRMSSYKNNRIVYVPDHVIVRDVESVLVGEAPASERDGQLRARVDYSLRMLGQYAQALRAVRESGVVDYKEFPYGL